ncbi:hypothetical protein T484DRAFT_1774510 [Baffinella frigidus]|nr:hypothetical protein T484DRAFT_1774510 [Cryptophyta sp. CCMP2293]
MVTSSSPLELTGKLHLVRDVRMTSARLGALLDHEIGTHFLRAYNHHARNLPNEEGLATLNTLLFGTSKSLVSSAISYYAQWRATELGFSELFQDLRQFVPSPQSRWAFCFRVKRGLRDTSLANNRPWRP